MPPKTKKKKKKAPAGATVATRRFRLASSLGGVIFLCPRSMLYEAVERQLFGLPPPFAELIVEIRPGLPLFLFILEDQNVLGPFAAGSSGALHIEPSAWHGRLPAQVRVRDWNVKSLRSLPLAALVASDNILEYYGTSKQNPKFDLGHEQVRSLNALLVARGDATAGASIGAPGTPASGQRADSHCLRPPLNITQAPRAGSGGGDEAGTSSPSELQSPKHTAVPWGSPKEIKEQLGAKRELPSPPSGERGGRVLTSECSHRSSSASHGAAFEMARAHRVEKEKHKLTHKDKEQQQSKEQQLKQKDRTAEDSDQHKDRQKSIDAAKDKMAKVSASPVPTGNGIAAGAARAAPASGARTAARPSLRAAGTAPVASATTMTASSIPTGPAWGRGSVHEKQLEKLGMSPRKSLTDAAEEDNSTSSGMQEGGKGGRSGKGKSSKSKSGSGRPPRVPSSRSASTTNPYLPGPDGFTRAGFGADTQQEKPVHYPRRLRGLAWLGLETHERKRSVMAHFSVCEGVYLLLLRTSGTGDPIGVGKNVEARARALSGGATDECHPCDVLRGAAGQLVQKVSAVVESLHKSDPSIGESAFVESYGSFATGLWLPGCSDIDLMFMNAIDPFADTEATKTSGSKSKSGPPQTPEQNAYRKLAQALDGASFATQVQAIESATVPVIKFMGRIDVGKDALDDDDDENAGIFEMPVDVIMEQPSSIAVREYVLEKINELPFLMPMVLVIKRFLNVRRMKDVYYGGLGSYSLTLMVIFFLLYTRSDAFKSVNAQSLKHKKKKIRARNKKKHDKPGKQQRLQEQEKLEKLEHQRQQQRQQQQSQAADRAPNVLHIDTTAADTGSSPPSARARVAGEPSPAMSAMSTASAGTEVSDLSPHASPFLPPRTAAEDEARALAAQIESAPLDLGPGVASPRPTGDTPKSISTKLQALPAVASTERSAEHRETDNGSASRAAVVTPVPEPVSVPLDGNDMDLGETLRSFFAFFGNLNCSQVGLHVDDEKGAVFFSHPGKFPLVVDDPLNPGMNVAYGSFGFWNVQLAFKEAAMALQKGKATAADLYALLDLLDEECQSESDSEPSTPA